MTSRERPGGSTRSGGSLPFAQGNAPGAPGSGFEWRRPKRYEIYEIPVKGAELLLAEASLGEGLAVKHVTRGRYEVSAGALEKLHLHGIEPDVIGGTYYYLLVPTNSAGGQGEDAAALDDSATRSKNSIGGGFTSAPTVSELPPPEPSTSAILLSAAGPCLIDDLADVWMQDVYSGDCGQLDYIDFQAHYQYESGTPDLYDDGESWRYFDPQTVSPSWASTTRSR